MRDVSGPSVDDRRKCQEQAILLFWKGKINPCFRKLTSSISEVFLLFVAFENNKWASLHRWDYFCDLHWCWLRQNWRARPPTASSALFRHFQSQSIRKQWFPFVAVSGAEKWEGWKSIRLLWGVTDSWEDAPGYILWSSELHNQEFWLLSDAVMLEFMRTLEEHAHDSRDTHGNSSR